MGALLTFKRRLRRISAFIVVLFLSVSGFSCAKEEAATRFFSEEENAFLEEKVKKVTVHYGPDLLQELFGPARNIYRPRGVIKSMSFNTPGNSILSKLIVYFEENGHRRIRWIKFGIPVVLWEYSTEEHFT